MPSSPNKTGGPAKQPMLIYSLIFLAGFLTGVGFTVYKITPVTANAPSASQEQGQAHNHEFDEAIANLESLVTKEPQNAEAWAKLGHLYYDSNQPDKAIRAYEKNLSLGPHDPNILTDLGVMYRQVNQPQRAIELFAEAASIDPSHQQSRFNRGVVMLYDLNNPQEALASWQELLSLAPDAKAAGGKPLKELVAELEADLASGK